jgi:hypothetical protein
MPFTARRPEDGRYSPTSNFTRDVFPEPDGPTKAMVSPARMERLTLSSDGVVEDG